MRILIVEDDPLLGPGLQTGLSQDGFASDLVTDAAAAEHALRLEHFDLVLLDLGLPGRDGLELLRELREQGSCIPVLIVTARDTIGSKITGLDCGADDYMVKPFDLDELSARIRALLRRSQRNPAPVLQVGDLTLDTTTRQVAVDGQLLYLSPKEYTLLETLMTNADQVVPRARLQSTVYGWMDDVDSNALEVHIHNLRRKLGKGRIVTARGVGYQLVATGAA